jgi:hypothetical protein
MKSEHPYQQYEGSSAWNVLDKGISDLKANGDLAEMTERRYIVGYLLRLLDESNLIPAGDKGAQANRTGPRAPVTRMTVKTKAAPRKGSATK